MNQELIKKKILFVDDDIDFLSQMKPQLELAGFDVSTAESKEEAIQLLTKVIPDLVITDLMMENYDAGFELSYLVKKMNPEIPVIMVSNVTSEAGFKFSTSTEEERNWVKADIILNKPVRFGQLIKEINQHLK